MESAVDAPKPTLRPRLVLPAIRMRVRRDRAAFVGCPGPPNGRNVVVRQIGHAAFVVGRALFEIFWRTSPQAMVGGRVYYFGGLTDTSVALRLYY